jgi:hypothetical protein
VNPRFIAPPDVLTRQVLFAVELIDPITHSLVSRDVKVTADGITNKPIVNRSGRFVWLREGNAWPSDITFDPKSTPFERHVEPAVNHPRPADLSKATPLERLVTITLRPTATYPFDTGATVVRGRLVEDATVDPRFAVPVPAATVHLVWQDMLSGAWFPPLPPLPPMTGSKGEFAAVLQLRPPALTDPDIDHGLLKVQVRITRGAQTLRTKDNFPFLLNPAPGGRVPEGRLLPGDVTLGWSQLVPI